MVELHSSSEHNSLKKVSPLVYLTHVTLLLKHMIDMVQSSVYIYVVCIEWSKYLLDGGNVEYIYFLSRLLNLSYQNATNPFVLFP